jgi:microcystin degradation protein MlrC
MRIAVGTLSHETNTFTARPTALSDFETATGEDLLDAFSAGRSLGGIVDRLRSAGAEVVPTVGAATIPSGTVTAEAFEWMQSELAARLAGEALDGVCLDLHGSMYVDGEPDPEGAVLETVRNAVGDGVPVTAGLDMHATITGRLVDLLDGVAGYRTAPHTDVVETGERAADLLLADRRGDADLALAWERIPMLLAGERSETEAEPMNSLVGRLRDADGREAVYDANFFLGFPWADSPHAGCHALVTGDAGARESVVGAATDLAAAFWERREDFDFTTEAHPPAEALDVAATETERPVAVAETGDIPGAGGSQDAVDFLDLVLGREDLGTPVAAIYADADAYAACADAGAGATVDLDLGRFVERDGSFALSGTVRQVESYDGTNVALVAADGADVLVADGKTNLHRDPAFFRAFDVAPADREVVVLKSGYLSPAWKETAARRLFALTAGDTDQRVEEIPYERVPRPIYPADPETTFESDVRWSA